MMQIVLNIDGVMIPAKPWVSLPLMEDGFYEFKFEAVKALNKVLQKTAAKIILTTSHKHKFTLEQWLSIFINRGIQINSITRLPKNEDFENRAFEIQNWYINFHSNESFVIIDDDKSLNELPINIKNHLVQTKPLIGFNENHINEVLEILCE